MGSRLIAAAAISIALLSPSLAAGQQRARGSATVAPRASATNTPQVSPASAQVPPARALIVLIKSHLLALNHANQTNVYHVLYGLGSDRFRATRTPDQLSQAFARFRASNVDFSSVIYLNPQLTAQPVIQQGRLRLVGFFPTTPVRLNYELYFEPSQGRWKMADMIVSLTPTPQDQATK